MTATILPLRGGVNGPDPAAALARLEAHLNRCALSANTVKAYRRQARAYLTWLADPQHAAEQADAFLDHIGAEAAVAAWRRALLAGGASPATVNQGLAAVALLYEHGASMRIKTKTARVPRPGAPRH
ncbi:unnamed protein product [[Actinomadura] parvosata subsp. kistnae]|uniref:Core-binding (CB) domain-containing protein n=1 Tax=[Actinomadura] parvosata subsp. kistnae TaxID=1909395 RepID=A0A1U9ZYA2_9ACTN|nr:site-specific integrase [Nonomuraea sp. ATCC 55076]AQZ62928.1 hypothetical protein BKM31_16980 [Nonomuraea sp. ATCC 55076]SPL95823.1 unnamed protein product [Actinomadura parvosata subsp. kistnae]